MEYVARATEAASVAKYDSASIRNAALLAWVIRQHESFGATQMKGRMRFDTPHRLDWRLPKVSPQSSCRELHLHET
jgi:hypothetical protein